MTVAGILQGAGLWPALSTYPKIGYYSRTLERSDFPDRFGALIRQTPMIDASCPQCGTVYHADQIHVGKHVRCTRCGFLVPILHGSSGTIVERPAVAAHTFRHPSPSQRPTVRPVRRNLAYSAAIASIVITLAVVLLVHFRHPAFSGGQDATDFSDIDQFVASQDRRAASPPETHTDSTGSSEVISGEPVKSTRSSRSFARTSHLSAGDPNETAASNYHSLPNGTRISLDAGTEGHGKLTVENGTSEDAKVILYDISKNEKLPELYVQAGKSVEMIGIPAGTYELKYAAGFDWVEDQGFRLDPSFNEFEKTLQYTEQQNGEEIRYHNISVTLHPVIGGNVRTRRISREEFLMGHHPTLLSR